MEKKNINEMTKEDLINEIKYVVGPCKEVEDETYSTVDLIKELSNDVSVKIGWFKDLERANTPSVSLNLTNRYRCVDFMIIEEFKNIFDEIHALYKRVHPYLLRWDIINAEKNLTKLIEEGEREQANRLKFINDSRQKIEELKNNLNVYLEVNDNG